MRDAEEMRLCSKKVMMCDRTLLLKMLAATAKVIENCDPKNDYDRAHADAGGAKLFWGSLEGRYSL
jgi:hypothetical protein